MWEFLKKAAGAVVEAGANYAAQSMAVDRILNAPDFNTGEAWLRDHIHSLDSEVTYRIFMSIVEQRHTQAVQAANQGGYDGSWGGTIEDRMSYTMAHINAGVPTGNPQAEHLAALYEAMHRLAQHFWSEKQSVQHAPAQVLPEPPRQTVSNPEAWATKQSAQNQAQAFSKHLKNIEELFPDKTDTSGVSGSGSLTELDAFQLRIEADGCLANGMMRTMPGQASEEAIEALDTVHAKYARIIEDGPDDSQLLVRADLLNSMGQAREFAGRVCESLRDDERALEYFEMARKHFVEAGRENEVGRLDNKISGLKAALEGDPTGELERLETRKDDPLDEANRLMDLASYKGDDPKAAIDLVHEARKLLKANGMVPPKGRDIALDLTSSIEGFQSGDMTAENAPLARTMKIRSAYSSIYRMLIRLYDKTEPGHPDYDKDQQKADKYRKKLATMESQSENRDFSEIMLGMLNSGRLDQKQ